MVFQRLISKAGVSVEKAAEVERLYLRVIFQLLFHEEKITICFKTFRISVQLCKKITSNSIFFLDFMSSYRKVGILFEVGMQKN
jgi:hypothetical protein